ncbi:MAG: CAP domain-containing protein, partial [Lutibacter sp.]
GHTDYMIEVGAISHDNFAERAQILMEQAGAKTVGENVAYGFSTAEGVVNGWLNSEGHRKIIENPDYTHFGISTDSNTENRNYFTNIFIKK